MVHWREANGWNGLASNESTVSATREDLSFDFEAPSEKEGKVTGYETTERCNGLTIHQQLP